MRRRSRKALRELAAEHRTMAILKKYRLWGAQSFGLFFATWWPAATFHRRHPLRRTAPAIVSHHSPFVTLGLGGEALVAHTRSNACLFLQENALGSLEVGKQADLVVLDRDYMTVPVAQIKHIHPTLTMVGGRVVFSAMK